MCAQVAELEAQLGHPAAGQTCGEELSQSLEELRALLSAKEQVREKACLKLSGNFSPCNEASESTREKRKRKKNHTEKCSFESTAQVPVPVL